MQQILFSSQSHEFPNSEVLGEYDFGDEVATLVDADPETLEDIAGSTETLTAIEDSFTASLQTAIEATTDDPEKYADLGDFQSLHDIADADRDRTDTGDGITVVVMDTGIDDSHPLFEDVSVKHVDVTGQGVGDAVGHGTAVGAHIARLAPDVELIDLRIFGRKGRTGAQTILRAYEWLHKNTDEYEVVNMSWGASRRSERLDALQNKLIRKGVRDVVAAGNTGEKGGSPATASLAFSVGACTESGDLTSFSSYNPRRTNPDVTAIGKDVRLAQAQNTEMGVDLPGRWVMASGTSFSAPATAATVARYQSHVKAETGSPQEPRAVHKAFISASRDIPSTPRDGEGLVDYKATLELSGTPDPSPEEPDDEDDSESDSEKPESEPDSYLKRLQTFLERTFGAENVSTDTYYSREGYHPEFVVDGPFCTYVIEAENETGDGREGVGQAIDYAAAEIRASDSAQVIPVVVVPTEKYNQTPEWQSRLAQSDVLVTPFPRKQHESSS